MSGKVVCLLVVLGAVTALPDKSRRPRLVGVDPNTLSCDPDGHTHLLLPHFTDCSKFYVCTHGREVEFSCAPGGLYFDFELQTCNWPHSTQCWLRTPPEEEEGNSGEEEEEAVGGSGEEEEEEVEGSGEEFAEFEAFALNAASSQEGPVGVMAIPTGRRRGVFTQHVEPEAELTADHEDQKFSAILNCKDAAVAARQAPYKGDCQRFWRCVDGLPQTAYCSDGLFFNAKTSQCDFEANASCDLRHDDELQGEFLVYK